MGTTNTYAEAFPPGEFLREELEERGWTQEDLATVIGKSPRLVNEIINAKRSITPETAKALSAAFGTSAEYWMNLESAWQLFQLKHSDADVPRRARLYSKFPVKEIIKRGWIEDSDSIEVLESQFCTFYQLQSLDEQPRLAAAFRRGNKETAPSDSQVAWLYRAYQLAERMHVEKFSNASLGACLTRLRMLLTEPEEVRHVPRILAESGIRFVVVEQFPGSKVDGVCFWLERKYPVIAMSLRFDRIDNFWFTFMHEMRHLANRDWLDVPTADVDLEGSQPTSEVEERADREAADYLVPQRKLEDFIARVAPLYSIPKVVGFARTNGVHPGIVVGQLHRRKEIPYANLRKMLVKVREELIDSAITDGWGRSTVLTNGA